MSGMVNRTDQGKIMSILNAIKEKIASWKCTMPAVHSAGHVSVKPVQRRLLAPLAVVLLLLVVGFISVMIIAQQKSLKQSSRNKMQVAIRCLGEYMQKQSETLSALGDVLLRDASLADALKSHDRERLLTDYGPLFAQLRRYGITHFYLHSSDRMNLLHVHKPDKSGDLIDRFTILEAERTGETASGIELGEHGTFTLRVVQPVFDGETIIGYLELGDEIKSFLEDVSEEHSLELTVSIHKNVLNRQKWESGMKMLGREAEWDRFDDDVIIYSTLDRLPDEAGPFVGEAGHAHCRVTSEAKFNGKSWRVMTHPLIDASGIYVCDLVIMHDISEVKTAFRRLLTASLGAILVLLTGLLGFLYVLLRRTDRGIRLQNMKLRESEERYRAIAEDMPVLIRRFLPGGEITYVNNSYCKYFGKTEEELLGHTFLPVIPEADRETVMANISALTVESPTQSHEHQVIAPGGEIRWQRWSNRAMFDAQGKTIAYQSIGEDITERRQAELELQESENRFRETNRNLVEMANKISGVMSSAVQKNTSCETLRFEIPEMVNCQQVKNCGKTDCPAYSESKPTRCWAVAGTLCNGEVQGGYAKKIMDCRKCEVYQHAISNPIYNLGESFNVMIAVLAEREAELERSNEALKAITSNLEEINSELKNFAYVASHDLREPLRTISLFGQLLEDSLKEQLDEDDRENLRFIIDGASRMTQMIEAMLIFSRVGTIDIQFDNIDLNEAVKELKDLELTVLLEETGGTIFVPDLLPRVNGDAVQVRQLLQNLIANALKYHKPQTPPEVWIRADQVVDNMVRITIEDNGIGIKEEHYKDVFTMFKRLRSKSSYEGAGIGLSVCKKIIERHGGEIGVSSEFGKGTRFWFTLQAANVEEVGTNEQKYEDVLKTGSGK